MNLPNSEAFYVLEVDVDTATFCRVDTLAARLGVTYDTILETALREYLDREKV